MCNIVYSLFKIIYLILDLFLIFGQNIQHFAGYSLIK